MLTQCVTCVGVIQHAGVLSRSYVCACVHVCAGVCPCMLAYFLTSGGTPRALSRLEAEEEEQRRLILFGIRIDAVTTRYFLQPDTPGDLDAWVEAFDKLLLKMGKSELMIPLEDGVSGSSGGDSDSGVFGMAADDIRVQRLSEVAEEEDTFDNSALGGCSLDQAPSPGDGKLRVPGAAVMRFSIRHRQKGFVAMGRLNNRGVDETIYYPDNAMDISSMPNPPQPTKSLSPVHLLAPTGFPTTGVANGLQPPEVPSSPRPSPKLPPRNTAVDKLPEPHVALPSGRKSPSPISIPSVQPLPPPLETGKLEREDSDGMYIVPNTTSRRGLVESDSVESEDHYEVSGSSFHESSLRPIVEAGPEASGRKSPMLPPRPKPYDVSAKSTGLASQLPAEPEPYPDENPYEVDGSTLGNSLSALHHKAFGRGNVGVEDEELYIDAVEAPRLPAINAGVEASDGYVVSEKAFCSVTHDSPSAQTGDAVAKQFSDLPGIPSQSSPRPTKAAKPLVSTKPAKDSPQVSPRLKPKPPPPNYPPPADDQLQKKMPPPPPSFPPPPDTVEEDDAKLLADTSDILATIESQNRSAFDQDGYELDQTALNVLRQQHANNPPPPPPDLPGEEEVSECNIYATPEGRDGPSVAAEDGIIPITEEATNNQYVNFPPPSLSGDSATVEDRLYVNVAPDKPSAQAKVTPPPLPEDSLPPPPLPTEDGTTLQSDQKAGCDSLLTAEDCRQAGRRSPLTVNPLYGKVCETPDTEVTVATAAKGSKEATTQDQLSVNAVKPSGRVSPAPPPKPAKKKKSNPDIGIKSSPQLSRAGDQGQSAFQPVIPSSSATGPPPLPAKKTPEAQRNTSIQHQSPRVKRLSDASMGRNSGNWSQPVSSRNSLAEVYGGSSTPGGSPLPPRLPPKVPISSPGQQAIPVTMHAVRPMHPGQPQQIFLVQSPQQRGYNSPGTGPMNPMPTQMGMMQGHLVGVPGPMMMQDHRQQQRPMLIQQRSIPVNKVEDENDMYVPMGLEHCQQQQLQHQHQRQHSDLATGDDYEPMSLNKVSSNEGEYDDDYTPMNPPSAPGTGTTSPVKPLPQQQLQQQQQLAAMQRDRHMQALALQQELQVESAHMTSAPRTRVLTQTRGMMQGTVTMVPVPTSTGVRHVQVMSPPGGHPHHQNPAQFGLLRQHSVDNMGEIKSGGIIRQSSFSSPAGHPMSEAMMTQQHMPATVVSPTQHYQMQQQQHPTHQVIHGLHMSPNGK